MSALYRSRLLTVLTAIVTIFLCGCGVRPMESVAGDTENAPPPPPPPPEALAVEPIEGESASPGELESAIEEAKRLAAGKTASEDVDSFPWPPPRPTAAITFKLDGFLKKNPGASLGRFDSELSGMLKESGYGDRSYYTVPGGFAIATGVEKIHENGNPWDIKGRWPKLPIASRFAIWLKAYLGQLFLPDPGRYRVFVFFVTAASFRPDPRIAGEGQIKGWRSGGANKLPESVETAVIISSHVCTVYVYELEQKEKDKPATLRVEGGLPAGEHLRGAGLLAGLESLEKKK